MRDELEAFWDEFNLPLLGGLIYLILVIGTAIACYNIWG